jgi:hypothetical protein
LYHGLDYGDGASTSTAAAGGTRGCQRAAGSAGRVEIAFGDGGVTAGSVGGF